MLNNHPSKKAASVKPRRRKKAVYNGGGRSRTAVINGLVQLAKGVTDTIGANCEVVIHDLADLDNSPLFVSGNVTGRPAGSGPADFLLDKIRAGDYQDNLNYRTYSDDGKILKSSTIFLGDEAGSLTIAVCINLDVTPFMALQGTIDAMLSFDETASQDSGELFGKSVEETVRVMVAEVAATIGKPPLKMTKSDRLAVIQDLDQRGAFQMKRAVLLVAAQLGVSRYTVYSDLQEMRGGADDGSGRVG